MQKPPSYRHEPKVIINVRPDAKRAPGETPPSRNSEPTIVNMPIPKEHRSTITKTRIAVGTALGLMGIATGVILGKDILKDPKEKTHAPTATPTQIENIPPNILVATNAPSVTNTAEIAAPALEDSAEDPEEDPIPTATATAALDLPKTASALPVNATAAPTKTWTAPKPQPPQKSGIIREVPF